MFPRLLELWSRTTRLLLQVHEKILKNKWLKQGDLKTGQKKKYSQEKERETKPHDYNQYKPRYKKANCPSKFDQSAEAVEYTDCISKEG